MKVVKCEEGFFSLSPQIMVELIESDSKLIDPHEIKDCYDELDSNPDSLDDHIEQLGYAPDKYLWDSIEMNGQNYHFYDGDMVFNFDKGKLYLLIPDIKYASKCRSNEKLINLIEKYGEQNAGSRDNKLKVVDIPDDVDYQIYSNQFGEVIREKHRSW